VMTGSIWPGICMMRAHIGGKEEKRNLKPLPFRGGVGVGPSVLRKVDGPTRCD